MGFNFLCVVVGLDSNQILSKQAIRDLLHKKIQLFTTKTGDVVIFSTGRHTGDYRLVNLKSGSSDVSSSYDFTSKKKHYLGVNQDTLRDKIIVGLGANKTLQADSANCCYRAWLRDPQLLVYSLVDY